MYIETAQNKHPLSCAACERDHRDVNPDREQGLRLLMMILDRWFGVREQREHRDQSRASIACISPKMESTHKTLKYKAICPIKSGDEIMSTNHTNWCLSRTWLLPPPPTSSAKHESIKKGRAESAQTACGGEMESKGHSQRAMVRKTD